MRMWLTYLSGENPGRINLAHVMRIEADRADTASPWKVIFHFTDGSQRSLPDEFTSSSAAEAKIDDLLLNGS